MAAKKTIVKGNADKVPAKAAKGLKARLMATEPLATILKSAQEPVVQHYLELLQLPTEGELSVKTARLFAFLHARFEKAEPELGRFVQMCDCGGYGHAAFEACPFCGDKDESPAAKAQAKAARGEKESEADAAQVILRRWPEGFERVVSPPPVKIVQTSPGAVKTAKKSRSAAASKKAEELKIPVGEAVAPPSEEELAVTFRQILKKVGANKENAPLLSTLIAKAGDIWENVGSESLAWRAIALLEDREEVVRFLDADDEIRFTLPTTEGLFTAKLVAAFGRALDAEAPNATSMSALLDAVAADDTIDVNLDPAVDGDVIKKALLLLVQSGRATRRGAMFVSTAEATMAEGVPEDEPDSDEQRAIHEPEDDDGLVSDRSDTGGAEMTLALGEGAAPLQAIVVEHAEVPGTVEELDEAVTKIHELHAQVALSVYEMGVLLDRIINGKLYLQRRHATTGHPVYETFTQFAAAELKIGKAYAYQLAALPSKYTRVQIEKAGPRKLTLLLAVTDVPTRERLAEKTVAEGLSSGQLKLEIEKAQPGAGKASAPSSQPAPDVDEDESDDEAPESEKPRQPAPKPAQPTPSKGPTATATPREQRITATLMPGRQVVDLFARQIKKSAPLKRAKKIEQDPWGAIELGNGVRMEFRVYVGEGGALQLAMETTRSGS